MGKGECGDGPFEVGGEERARGGDGPGNPSGLAFERAFSAPGREYPEVERTAEIRDGKGAVKFRQEGLRFPEAYSQLAVNVVAGKYFYGDAKSGGGRESSLVGLVDRVVGTIAEWGLEGRYFRSKADVEAFADDLRHLCVEQYAAFNSPVWFNVGLHRLGVSGDYDGYRWDAGASRPVPVAPGEAYRYPQAGACFIIGVDDSISGIYERAAVEGRIFKYGSGAGSNNSSIRSCREVVRGGGRPSGPLSFMQVYDAVAKVTKSGGINRRAAKMEIIDDWHPDVMEFIQAKKKEESKAHALIREGYESDFNGEAYSTVCFQNSNMSVRFSDAFMAKVSGEDPDGSWETLAVTTGTHFNANGVPMPTYNADELFDSVARGTWDCGDPGVQFSDTINRWNTVKAFGPINASNPCSEFVQPDDTSCNLSSLNLLKFRTAGGGFDVDRFRAAVRTMIVAQEILVDRAGYPTEAIARNSHDLRPLGLGFANLGALLMSYGLPYDSDEARLVAGAVSAVMHAQANLTSVELARVVGPFAAYPANADSMMEVMRMHHAQLGRFDRIDRSPRFVRELVESARTAWDRVLREGAGHGFRNSQVTLIAPTGCAVPSTLVLTDRGLRRLGTLGDVDGPKWQDVDFRVQTPDGPESATRFFVNGPDRVVRVETGRGYRFVATHEHRIKVVDAAGDWVWRRMAEMQVGDVAPVQLGGMFGCPVEVPLPKMPRLDPRASSVSVPRTVTRDLAELLGAFMANGSLHTKGLRVSVAGGDTELIARTGRLFSRLFGLRADATPSKKEDETTVSVNSVPLRRWWKSAGFAKLPRPDGLSGKGKRAFVPDAVLHTNDPEIYCAFLRGFIDHDGGVASGIPEICNTNRDAVADMQVICLALGFPTSLRSTRCGISGKPLWRARLVNKTYAAEWMSKVGFTEARKRDAVRPDATQSGRKDLVYLPCEVFDRVCPIRHPSRNSAFHTTRQEVGKAEAGGLAVAGVRVMSRTRAEAAYAETGDPDLGRALGFFYDKVSRVEELDAVEETFDLSVPANVTWTGGGFVSHNTISFMMDCDTTGVEPELALVKHKLLAGGGTLKIVNRTVELALETLGYSPRQVAEIRDHIDATDSMEGAPHLQPEHLSVFDCSFASGAGGRAIHYGGHLRMMAAVQAWLSGAISKTVNMPEESTVEDVRNAYLEAWKLGLKCVAIYRDGSKKSQPLTTKKQDEAPVAALSEEESARIKAEVEAKFGPSLESAGIPLTPRMTVELVPADREEEAPAPPPKPAPRRERLPDTRRAVNHKFNVGGHEGYINVGLYRDGRPGELFITMAKEGSTIGGLMDAIGTLTSIGLQYGVPMEVLARKLSHVRFEPSGFTKNPDVPMAKSVVDYVFRWLGNEFVAGFRGENAPARPADGPAPAEALEYEAPPAAAGRGPSQEDAPACAECGAITVRTGACYTCTQCGASSGCS